jgi:predicted Fe-S protein YdhL (DUF1289 family)
MHYHPPPEPTADAPCIRNCCLDPQDICMGCGRTLAEIRDWHGLDSDQRRAVLTRAATRRADRQRLFLG